MSINSAMLSGVSGLVANSAALGAISDNIANANTVGYKRNVTNFEDLVTASASGGSYNSGGVTSSTTQLVTAQGQLTQTQSNTDLGISGDGFFVVSGQANGNPATDPYTFTRAGSFSPDSQGYLKNAAGFYLQGWLADSSGAITPNPSDLGKLSTINVSSIGNSPNPTTSVGLNLNLDSSQAVSTAAATAGAYDPATPAKTMSAYDPTAGTGVKPDFTTQATIYDAQGGAHTVQVDFLKAPTANTWHVEVQAVPSTDVAGTTNGLLASGDLTFNSDGTLSSVPSALSNLTIGASTATTGIHWAAPSGTAGTTAVGLPSQTFSLAFNGNSGAVTQNDKASVTNTITTDGGPAGTLTGVTVDKYGVVTAKFSNGATRAVAQVALATFPNPDGLSSLSGDTYQVSLDSGTYTLKQPGSGGAGNVEADNLEASTVDLSTEFTGLIITQRAYAASSKIITTADEMLQELINTKQ